MSDPYRKFVTKAVDDARESLRLLIRLDSLAMITEEEEALLRDASGFARVLLARIKKERAQEQGK